MRHALRTAIIATCVACSWPTQGLTQSPARVSLQPSDAKLTEEFSRLISVRELSDGRVLLSDNRDNRVVLADFRSNTVVPVGRVGSGPSEYRRAGPLIAMGQDSTILTDPGNGRWLILTRERIVATVTRDDPVVALASIPSGADRSGAVLAQRFGIGGGGEIDSTVLILASRSGGRMDTVARLRTQSMRVGAPVRNTTTGVSVQRISVSGWSSGEQAILFDDGWIGIARLEPYRVEWYRADGTRVVAPPLPFTPTKVDDREKEAYVARSERPAGRAAAQVMEWPDEIPAFLSTSSVLGEPAPALRASSDGRLLIERVPTASTPEPRYDIVARDGKLQGQLVLGPSERVLGFGARHIYVVVVNDDGIQTLSRHPWP